MKKLFFSALALTTLGLAAFAPTAELPIGADLPMATAKMKDVSGDEISFQDAQKAQGLLVMFSCNTCPYVVKNQERTVEIARYAQQQGIGVVVVNSNEGQRSGDDSFEAMQAYAQKQNYEWHYVVDDNSEVADAFGANRTPEIFLFDAKGKLAYHGAIDDNPSDAASVNRHHLKEAISEMIGGKDITVKTSRSVGCTIKRTKK